MDEARAGDTQPDAGAEQKNVPGSTAAVQHYCLLHSLLWRLRRCLVRLHYWRARARHVPRH